MLHVMSFSVEEGVVGVIAILSTSTATATASFAFSCPATVSKPLLGDNGAVFPEPCFSIRRSSCIVEAVTVTALLALLPIDDFVVADKELENRLVPLKSPINRSPFSSFLLYFSLTFLLSFPDDPDGSPF